MTSSVDKKQNEKGDDVNNNGKRKVMLDYYGKCKYKMLIINKKKKKCQETHTCHKRQADNYSNINNKIQNKII